MEFLKLIDEYKDDIIKSTQDIIRIKSVEEEPKEGKPFGEGPYEALKKSLEIAENMGFFTKNMEGYAGYAEMGRGDKTVGVLAHVDVVPEGDGWDYPPYGAEIHNNRIYGRGTVDDKGPAIAILYAMKALKESGVEMNKKIRLILGANEETGWGCMDYYFKHEEAPDMAFTPDADFPVIYGEKGIIDFDLVYGIENDSIELVELVGGNAPNMVPDKARITLKFDDISLVKSKIIEDENIEVEIEGNTVTISAVGISAHGSTPENGISAIDNLMKYLGTVIDEDTNLGQYISLYNDRIGFKLNGESIGCGFSDDVSGKLTFNPGVIKYSGEEISLRVNVRYPIKSSSKEVYQGIRENLKATKLNLIESDSDNTPLFVPKDNFLVTTLMEVYRDYTGDRQSEPITIGGGTYARAMDNCVAFGPMFPGQEDVVHQKNEYIEIDKLIDITKIYALALYELTK